MKTTTNRFARTAMMLLLAMLTTNLWAQTTLTLSGEGTENNPYLIETAEHWNNLADYVAEGNNCESLYFEMTANIGSAENPITKPLGRQAGSQHSDRKRFAGIFDGAGFVYINVAGGRRDHPFIIFQHGGDHDLVGLGPAGEKFHLGVFQAAGKADLFPGALAVPVSAVAAEGFQIGFHKPLQHLRMGACNIITFK